MSGLVRDNSISDYCWLRVRIFGRKDDESPFPLEAELDDGSWFSGQFSLSTDEEAELLALEPEVREYGITLGRLIFHDEILNAYQIAVGRARELKDGRLRIQIWISPECSELQSLMWERVYVDLDGKHVSLSCSDLTPFSRFTRLSKADPRPISDRPFKLLIAISNPNPNTLPEGYAPIEVETEIENIISPLEGIEDLKITLLPGRTGISAAQRKDLKARGVFIEDGPTTPESLQIQLASNHILHFLGHGMFRRNKSAEKTEPFGTSFLILEDDKGDYFPVSDDELVARLAAFKDVPRLIFLASCETAKRDPQDPHPFVGLGPKLVEAGFPAVVAMQDKVPVITARKLTRFFYRSLLEQGLIDLALNESRKFLLDESQTDWAIPVLFMRTPGGRLFAPNPVIAALRSMAASTAFKPKWQYGFLPLEAVLLTGGQQRSPDWQRIVQQTATRVDLWKQTNDILVNVKSEMTMLAISGDRGTARSTHLRRLVRHTIAQSLNASDQKTVLPIYVDLFDSVKRLGPNADFMTMLVHAMREFWPFKSDNVDKNLVLSMLKDTGTIIRLIIDNLEDLPQQVAAQLIQDIRNLTKDVAGGHQFVIAIGHGGDEYKTLPFTHLLDVQYLSRRRVQRFLRDDIGISDDNDSTGAVIFEEAVAIGVRLADALEKTQLFDLAAQPWLLVHMVERAKEEYARLEKHELWPPSRALLLKDVVEGKIQSIPRDRGMQARALDTMLALASQMQFSNRGQMPLEEAIPQISTIRGEREYGLEELIAQFSNVDLMLVTGNESLRFQYPSLQSYCCARSILQDLPASGGDDYWKQVVSSLGGLNQIRWWFDTLVLLSGLLDNPDELIEQIIYGESFAESEKVFLAARCLLESQRVRETRKLSGQEETEVLADQIRNSLLWLLQKRNSASMQKLSGEVSKTLSSLLKNYRQSPDFQINQMKNEGVRKGKTRPDLDMLLDAFHELMERVQIVGSGYVAERVIESLIWRSSSVNEPRSYQRLRAIEEIGRFRRPEIVTHLVRVAMTKVRITWSRDMSFEYGGIRQAAGRAIRRLMPEFESDLKEADPALAELVDFWKQRNIEKLAELLKTGKGTAGQVQIEKGIPEMAAFALGDIQTPEARNILFQTILDGKTQLDTQWAIADAIALLDPEEVMNQVILKLIPTLEELEKPGLKVTATPNKRWHEMVIYLVGQLRTPEQRTLKFVESFLDDPGAGFGLKARSMLALAYLHQEKFKKAFEDAALGNFQSINLDKKLWTKASEYLKIKAIEALSEIGDADSLKRIRGSHKEWTPEIERVFYITSEEINWRLNKSS